MRYSLNDRTVVRGGYGVFYTQVSTDEAHQTALYTVSAVAERLNDGRADFAANPFNGPCPDVRGGARDGVRRHRHPTRLSPP